MTEELIKTGVNSEIQGCLFKTSICDTVSVGTCVIGRPSLTVMGTVGQKCHMPLLLGTLVYCQWQCLARVVDLVIQIIDGCMLL